MIPYILCLFPILLVAVFPTKKKASQQSKHFILALMPLALLMAFKSKYVGADTINYNNMFITMLEGTFDYYVSNERIEIGYKLFLKIISSISHNSQIQHVVYASVFVFSFGHFIKKNAKSSARFVVLFMGMNLFSFYLTGIRQSLAMMICLFAYECIKEKKPIKFILIVCLATLFHKSAMFFLFAYPIARMKVTKKKIPLYVAMFLFVVVGNKFLFDFAGDFFYLKYGIEETGNGYISVIIMAIITVLSFLKIKPLLSQNPNNMYLINLNAIHMAMWVLRLFSRTAERPSMFYTVFTILLVEQLILTIENPKDRFLINAATVCFFGAFFIYRINGSGLVPYTFFWQ